MVLTSIRRFDQHQIPSFLMHLHLSYMRVRISRVSALQLPSQGLKRDRSIAGALKWVERGVRGRFHLAHWDLWGASVPLYKHTNFSVKFLFNTAK